VVTNISEELVASMFRAVTERRHNKKDNRTNLSRRENLIYNWNKLKGLLVAKLTVSDTVYGQ
jgi:hypothetical protein